jgi:hypothetical protein
MIVSLLPKEDGAHRRGGCLGSRALRRVIRTSVSQVGGTPFGKQGPKVCLYFHLRSQHDWNEGLRPS